MRRKDLLPLHENVVLLAATGARWSYRAMRAGEVKTVLSTARVPADIFLSDRKMPRC